MANYPKCPLCGATGPIGAEWPQCACDYATAAKREQAALWYDRRSQVGGVIGVQFRANAAKVRAGKADSRLNTILAEQADYD